jgi:hypothetical protein
MNLVALPLTGVPYAGNSQAITTYNHQPRNQTGGVMLVDRRLISKPSDAGSGPAVYQDPGATEGEHAAPLAVIGVQANAEYRLANDIAQLEDLVRRGEFAEGCDLVKGIEERWPDDEQVQRFARVLAPPTVSVRQGSPARPRQQEYRWLREHSRDYPGCWLAVLGDRLIAANADAKLVVKAVEKDPSARGALLHFEPEV